MIRAAVLGSPIAHSLSPKIHNKAFEILEISGEYQAIEVDENTFPTFFAENSEANWNGFSLTMPLKEIVLQASNQVDDRARRIDSANTLYRLGDGWAVTSTDYSAFENLLSVDANANVAIIGGGGTARAAIGSLNSKLKSVDVLLRNPARVQAMSTAAPDIKVKQCEMGTSLDSYDLIIQTTPSGAFDQYVTNLNSTTGVLLECLYKPWPTRLASRFAELGGTVISGKELLVEQALFQIELFTQMKIDFAQMRQALLAHISSD
jgi:shikimate dehydrogenase